MVNMESCDNKTDEELVGLSLKDSDHFFCLSKRYEEKLLRYIIHISKFSREDAEDVLQEVYIKVWNSFDMFDAAKGRLYTWLSNMARNLAIDKIRSKDFRNQSQNQDIENSVNAIDVRMNNQLNPENMVAEFHQIK